MVILVLNCGSSSIKYQVIDIDDNGNTLLAKGLVDRIGLPDGRKINKNDPETAILKEWVDQQYEGGRMTFISEEEMEDAVKLLLPVFAPYIK